MTDEWQDIATAPRDGTRVLLWPTDVYGKPATSGSYASAHSKWFEACDGISVLHPTKWMPMPEPPK